MTASERDQLLAAIRARMEGMTLEQLLAFEHALDRVAETQGDEVKTGGPSGTFVPSLRFGRRRRR